MSQVILLFIWASIVTQWNLVFGVAGIFSLAQMAVFTMGGYTAAMLSLYMGWSLWITSFLGALMAVLVSGIIGATTIRLRGAYVALLTIGFAVVMQVLILTDSDCFFYRGVTCYNFTGGSSGLSQFGDFGFRDWLGYKKSLVGKYYLALFLLALGTIFALVIIARALRLRVPGSSRQCQLRQLSGYQSRQVSDSRFCPVGVLYRAFRRILCRALQDDRPDDA